MSLRDSEIKKLILNNCIILPHYKAKCKFCESELSYANFDKFKNHIKSSHHEIWNYETMEIDINDKYFCNFFKYSSELFVKCMICNEEICIYEHKESHLFSSHTDQERLGHHLSTWARKYFTQNGYFTVQCNICHETVDIHILAVIRDHMVTEHLDRLVNTQETHDTAGPSQDI